MKLGIPLLFCVLAIPAFPAELVPTQSEEEVGVRIVAPDYPDALPRELQSGLTNRLYVRVTLRDGATALQHRTAEIAIRYDLWEQNFSVTRTVDSNLADNLKLGSLAEVNALLAGIELPRLFPLRSLPADRELILDAELMLNPIGRERLRMIRKWVAENSTPGLGAESGITPSSSLFNRIFEQYADGSDVAATWHLVLSSRPFRAAHLANERR